MFGESDYRGKKTRLKVLMALATNGGSASFTEIASLTDLSTGSIYYSIDKMKNFVTRKSKRYYLTERGVDVLRESGAMGDRLYAKLHRSNKRRRVNGLVDILTRLSGDSN